MFGISYSEQLTGAFSASGAFHDQREAALHLRVVVPSARTFLSEGMAWASGRLDVPGVLREDVDGTIVVSKSGSSWPRPVRIDYAFRGASCTITGTKDLVDRPWFPALTVLLLRVEPRGEAEATEGGWLRLRYDVRARGKGTALRLFRAW